MSKISFSVETQCSHSNKRVADPEPYQIDDMTGQESLFSQSQYHYSPSGAAEPQPRSDYFGEHCLSEASCAAKSFGAAAKESRRDRGRARMVLGPFAETKGPRRAGAKARMINGVLRQSSLSVRIFLHASAVSEGDASVRKGCEGSILVLTSPFNLCLCLTCLAEV